MWNRKGRIERLPETAEQRAAARTERPHGRVALAKQYNAAYRLCAHRRLSCVHGGRHRDARARRREQAEVADCEVRRGIVKTMAVIRAYRRRVSAVSSMGVFHQIAMDQHQGRFARQGRRQYAAVVILRVARLVEREMTTLIAAVRTM